MSNQDDVPGSLNWGYVLPEEERRMQTDLWSDPHDGFMAEMLLLLTSELLQPFFLSTLLSVIGFVLGQPPPPASLSLSPSVISLFYMSWLFLFFMKFKLMIFPARVYSSSLLNLTSSLAHLFKHSRGLRTSHQSKAHGIGLRRKSEITQRTQ